MNILNVQDLKGCRYVINLKCQNRPVGRAGSKFKFKYKDVICTFDIETTKLEDIKQSVMYLWSFHIENLGTIVGRTWNEFKELILMLSRWIKDDERVVVYSHFLTHEFQYLKGIYSFRDDDIFAIESRKIARCVMCGKIEFRCSYLLTNQSLDEFLKDMKCEHQKLEIDYDVKRYAYTNLPESDILYNVHDTVGLCEAIRALMISENDTLYTIPMTSTGYMRREIKSSMHNFSRYNRDIYEVTTDLMQLAMQTFRGGDTHASRFYSDMVIKDVDIFKSDRSSSYMAEAVCKKLPIGKWIHAENISENDLKNCIMLEVDAFIARIRYKGIRLKRRSCPDPYIPLGKCIEYKDNDNLMNDNGRVMICDEIVIGVTDIDFDIIDDLYEWDDLIVEDVYFSRYGYLPDCITNIFKHYYDKKTRLKAITGCTIEYNQAKRKFNAGYGCMVQNPLNPKCIYNSKERKFNEEDSNLKKCVDDYNKKAYLSYFWGIWITARARMELYRGLNLVGDEYAIYWDTDGIVHCNPAGDKVFNYYNSGVKKLAFEKGMCAYDKNDEIHYAGVYESENHKIIKFKTYGAKKYVTEYEDGTEITISGVVKDDGSKELEEMGGIENWNLSTEFKKGGGKNFIYNDNICQSYITEDGKKIVITDNLYSEDSIYSMSISPEYADIIKQSKAIRRVYRQMHRFMLK